MTPLLGDLVRGLARGVVQPRRLGLEQIAVRHDRDERRLEVVRPADLGVDAIERVQVGVDGGVYLAGLRHEDDDVRRLGAQLERDRLQRRGRVVGLGRDGALLHAARVEDGHRAAAALVAVPLAPPGLRRDVPELRDLRPEERVHQRRLPGAAPAYEDDRGGSLVEQDIAQRADPCAQLLSHVEGQALEQVFDPLDRARKRVEGLVAARHGRLAQSDTAVRAARVEPERDLRPGVTFGLSARLRRDLRRPSSDARSLP